MAPAGAVAGEQLEGPRSASPAPPPPVPVRSGRRRRRRSGARRAARCRARFEKTSTCPILGVIINKSAGRLGRADRRGAAGRRAVAAGATAASTAARERAAHGSRLDAREMKRAVDAFLGLHFERGRMSSTPWPGLGPKLAKAFAPRTKSRTSDFRSQTRVGRRAQGASTPRRRTTPSPRSPRSRPYDVGFISA